MHHQVFLRGGGVATSGAPVPPSCLAAMPAPSYVHQLLTIRLGLWDGPSCRTAGGAAAGFMEGTPAPGSEAVAPYYGSGCFLLISQRFLEVFSDVSFDWDDPRGRYVPTQPESEAMPPHKRPDLPGSVPPQEASSATPFLKRKDEDERWARGAPHAPLPVQAMQLLHLRGVRLVRKATSPASARVAAGT